MLYLTCHPFRVLNTNPAILPVIMQRALLGQPTLLLCSKLIILLGRWAVVSRFVTSHTRMPGPQLSPQPHACTDHAVFLSVLVHIPSITHLIECTRHPILGIRDMLLSPLTLSCNCPLNLVRNHCWLAAKTD